MQLPRNDIKLPQMILKQTPEKQLKFKSQDHSPWLYTQPVGQLLSTCSRAQYSFKDAVLKPLEPKQTS